MVAENYKIRVPEFMKNHTQGVSVLVVSKCHKLRMSISIYDVLGIIFFFYYHVNFKCSCCLTSQHKISIDESDRIQAEFFSNVKGQ